MATKEEVQRFLNQMKEKIKVFGIIYRDKGSSALCISFHIAEHPMYYTFK